MSASFIARKSGSPVGIASCLLQVQLSCLPAHARFSILSQLRLESCQARGSGRLLAVMPNSKWPTAGTWTVSPERLGLDAVHGSLFSPTPCAHRSVATFSTRALSVWKLRALRHAFSAVRGAVNSAKPNLVG